MKKLGRMGKKTEMVFLALALAGSVAFAWQSIRSATIWYDETITLLTVAGHTTPDWSLGRAQFAGSADFQQILTQLYRGDVHPPLYFWTVAIWRVLAGRSLESVRLLSALFMAATVYLLYRVSERFPMRWPVVPALIYACSGAAIRYAFTARSYAMANFLIVLTLYCAQRRSRWTGPVAACSAATHYFSALCVAPLLLVYCGMRWKSDRRWALWTASSFAALFALLVPLLLVHFGARPDQFAGPGRFTDDIAAALNGAYAACFPISTVSRITNATKLVAVAYLVVGMILSIRRGEPAAGVTGACFLGGFVVLSVVSHKPVANMPVAYYFGFLAPLSALLAGFGVEAVPAGFPALAGLLLLSLANLRSSTRDRSDWRGTVASIRKQCDSCAIVVGAGSGRGVPASVLYEAGRIPVLVLSRQSFEKVVEQAAELDRFVLVPSKEPDSAAAEEEFIARFHMHSVKGYFALPDDH